MPSLASAKTKLLLFGEHAAVYGYPAVGVSLPWQVSVTLSSAKKAGIAKAAARLMDSEKQGNLIQKIFSLFPEIKTLSPFRIAVHSEIPVGLGLGSSGALSVALVKSLLLDHPTLDTSTTEEERMLQIWASAHELEKVFHGIPSGIDTGLSTFGGLLAFQREEGRELPAATPLNQKGFSLVVGAFPRHASTKELVAWVKKRRECCGKMAAFVEGLGEIAKHATSLLSTPLSHSGIKSLGVLADEAQLLLEKLGLSRPELETALRLGKALGSYGGKLSGAGAGGAYYLLAESFEHASQMAKELGIAMKKQALQCLIPPTAFGIPL